MLLFLIFCILCPDLGKAEDARLGEIRVVAGGKLKKRDRVDDIGVFVDLIGADGTVRSLDTKSLYLDDTVSVKSGANLLVKCRDRAKS